VIRASVPSADQGPVAVFNVAVGGRSQQGSRPGCLPRRTPHRYLRSNRWTFCPAQSGNETCRSELGKSADGCPAVTGVAVGISRGGPTPPPRWRNQRQHRTGEGRQRHRAHNPRNLWSRSSPRRRTCDVGPPHVVLIAVQVHPGGVRTYEVGLRSDPSGSPRRARGWRAI
jgi:hypothetical protein